MAMFENTTRWQATEENLTYQQCFKIPQDCRRGKIWTIEAPQYFAAAQYLAIFENTTRWSETGTTFYLLKPPNISQRLKIPQHWRPRGGKFKLLKPPNILPYLKIQQDFQPRGNILILEDTKYVTMFENTTRLQATGKSLSCWSHPMFSIFEGTTKLPETVKIQSIEATKKAMFNG